MLRAAGQQESNVVNILIIGAVGVGKAELAKSIVNIEALNSLQLKLRTASCLPLPQAPDRPMIDYVVFMVSLTNRDGFASLKRSVQLLDASYFVGRVCFLVTELNDYLHRSISPAVVSQLAQSYCSPVIMCDLKNEEDKLYCARMIVTNIEISRGLRGGCDTNILIAVNRLYEALSAKHVPEDDQPPSEPSYVAPR